MQSRLNLSGIAMVSPWRSKYGRRHAQLLQIPSMFACIVVLPPMYTLPQLHGILYITEEMVPLRAALFYGHP